MVDFPVALFLGILFIFALAILIGVASVYAREQYKMWKYRVKVIKMKKTPIDITNNIFKNIKSFKH